MSIQLCARGLLTQKKVLPAAGPFTDQLFLDGQIASAVFTKTTSTEAVMGTVDGECSPVQVGSIIGTATYTVAFTLPRMNRSSLALAFNEMWSPEPNYGDPFIKTTTIDDTGIITDEDLHEATDVHVTVLGGTNGTAANNAIRGLIVVTTGGVPTNTTSVLFTDDASGTTGTLSFDATGMENVIVKYTGRKKAEAGWYSLGSKNATNVIKLGVMQFRGIGHLVTGEEMRFEADIESGGGYTINVGTTGDQTLNYNGVLNAGERSFLRVFTKVT